MQVDFGSSSGWWIVADVDDQVEFFSKTINSKSAMFLKDLWDLNPVNPFITIDEFKTKWNINNIKELHYNVEGDISSFTIINNKYVQK